MLTALAIAVVASIVIETASNTYLTGCEYESLRREGKI